MQITFAILAALTLGSALAAMTLRNLVHCALCVAVTFAGLAALYLQLGAPFVGWAQILVYVGAVAILIVFAILLTRHAGPTPPAILSPGWGIGVAIAVGVFALLSHALLVSSLVHRQPLPRPDPTVREIGNQLMTRCVLPLEAIGLLLTAAAIGAVIIALKDSPKKPDNSPASSHGPGDSNPQP